MYYFGGWLYGLLLQCCFCVPISYSPTVFCILHFKTQCENSLAQLAQNALLLRERQYMVFFVDAASASKGCSLANPLLHPHMGTNRYRVLWKLVLYSRVKMAGDICPYLVEILLPANISEKHRFSPCGCFVHLGTLPPHLRYRQGCLA